MRLVVIGDIGVSDDLIHVGDEAMFEAATDALRARGAEQLTAISAEPADSRERYSLDAVNRIGFGFTSPDARALSEERMRLVLDAATTARPAQLAADDPAWQVIEAVRASDGVLVAGGGNLASTWPLHIFERATLGRLAQAFGKPFVVSGQTLGPHLTADDSRLVAEMLAGASLVGVRESASLARADSLGVAAELTVDDASFLTGSPVEAPAAPVGLPAAPYCLVTLASHVGDHDRVAAIAGIAALLDGVAERTGLRVLFSAHFGSLDTSRPRGDSLMHAAVAAQMRTPSEELPTTDARHSATLAREAALLISSRYHPAVFAAAAGVPAIGIAVDDYTTVKLTGALGNFGQHGVLDADAMIRGEGEKLAARVWAGRGDIRSRHLETDAAKRAASEAWWDRVFGAFA